MSVLDKPLLHGCGGESTSYSFKMSIDCPTNTGQYSYGAEVVDKENRHWWFWTQSSNPVQLDGHWDSQELSVDVYDGIIHDITFNLVRKIVMRIAILVSSIRTTLNCHRVCLRSMNAMVIYSHVVNS